MFIPFNLISNLDGKVVQTELPEEEYELLRDAVRKRMLSIKEGVKEAIREWINTQIPVKEDPLLKVGLDFLFIVSSFEVNLYECLLR